MARRRSPPVNSGRDAPNPLVMADIRDHADDARPRALLLDGDRVSRARLRALLEVAGWRPEPSAGDADALRRRGVCPARVVFADWPRLEPFWPDLLAAREAGEGSPYLVALIEQGSEADAAAALEAGADDCLLRPVRSGDLTARLAVALRAGRVRRGMRGAIAAASRERARAAAVLSSLPDGLVILAPDTTVVEVNDGLCAMTGIAREELVGRRTLFPHWPEEERPRLAAALVEAARSGTAERDVVLPRPDGTRFPAIVSIAAARGEGGRVGAYVATVKDLTDRVRSEQVRGALRRVGAVAASGIEADAVFDRIAREVAVLAGGAEGAVVRGRGPAEVVAAASGGGAPGRRPPRRRGTLRAPIELDGARWGCVVAAPTGGGRCRPACTRCWNGWPTSPRPPCSGSGRAPSPPTWPGPTPSPGSPAPRPSPTPWRARSSARAATAGPSRWCWLTSTASAGSTSATAPTWPTGCCARRPS